MVISEPNFPHRFSALLPSFNLARYPPDRKRRDPCNKFYRCNSNNQLDPRSSPTCLRSQVPNRLRVVFFRPKLRHRTESSQVVATTQLVATRNIWICRCTSKDFSQNEVFVTSSIYLNFYGKNEIFLGPTLSLTVTLLGKFPLVTKPSFCEESHFVRNLCMYLQMLQFEGLPYGIISSYIFSNKPPQG